MRASKRGLRIFERLFEREWLQGAFVIETDGRLGETAEAGEIVASCRKANAQIDTFNSEALKLISDDERGVLHGRRSQILQIIEEENRACLGWPDKMIPRFNKGVMQQSAARTEEILPWLPVNG